jgi:hypothetical protein
MIPTLEKVRIKQSLTKPDISLFVVTGLCGPDTTPCQPVATVLLSHA